MNNSNPQGWKERKLGSCLEKVIDNRGKTPPTLEAITPYGLIEVNALAGDSKFPNYSAIRKYVSKETYESWFRCGHPGKGDVLFATVGTIAEVAILNENRGSIAQNLIALRPNNEMLASDFLYYHFITPSIRQSLISLDISSVQPSIKVPHLLNTTILLPPLPEQRAIASVLSSLDDKIDLLHRQNKTLEAMAEALWRKMFVEEADPRWKKGKLGDIADNVRESVSVKDLKRHEHYVGLEHLERKHIALYSWENTAEIESNKLLFKRKDVLFGKLRAYFHKVCFAPIDGICSTDILVIRPKEKDSFSFCLLWFFNEDVVNYSDASSSGTRMPRTNWDTLSGYEMAIPPEEVIVSFNNKILPMIDKINQNIFSIHTLAHMRDTLLPKLMSGEVRVRL